MKKSGPACVLLLFIILPLLCDAQSLQPPPIDSNALKLAILTYTRSNAAEARLYNGILYPGYNRQAKGHPFFLVDSFITASIDYDGILYPMLPLSYDLEKDIVITPNKKQNTTIQLLTEKVSGFTIDGHNFIYLLPDSSAVNPPPPGFYEVLYKGSTTALVRHRKLVQAGIHIEDPSNYVQFEDWYLDRNGHYTAIRTNSNLISTSRKQDKSLKDYLKKNHLDFRKAPAAAIAAAAEFYSRSNN